MLIFSISSVLIHIQCQQQKSSHSFCLAVQEHSHVEPLSVSTSVNDLSFVCSAGHVLRLYLYKMHTVFCVCISMSKHDHSDCQTLA